MKEGTTYSTGVGFSAQEDIDLETVPSGKPKAELLPLNDTVDCSLVFFDVERTSLDFSTEITQIAAVHATSGFSTYVLPVQGISPATSRVTGITKVTHRGKPELCMKGKVVESVTVSEAMMSFIDWLKSIESNNILLCTHNAKKFDVHVVLLAAKNAEQVTSLGQVVCGFSDTLDAFKDCLPGKKSYAQEKL